MLDMVGEFMEPADSFLMKMNLITAGALLLMVAGVAEGANVSFSDGSFANTISTRIGGSGGQASVQVGSGGNPDAYWSVTTSNNAHVVVAHLDPAHSYDPSNGAISSLSFGIDYNILFAFGQGMAYGVAAKQDGNYFVAAGQITGSSDSGWMSHSSLALDEGSFSPVDGGVLDFSETGSPIIFGFETANSGGSGIHIGYDNWSVVLQTVPEPTFSAFLALSALVLLMRKREPN